MNFKCPECKGLIRIYQNYNSTLSYHLTPYNVHNGDVSLLTNGQATQNLEEINELRKKNNFSPLKEKFRADHHVCGIN